MIKLEKLETKELNLVIKDAQNELAKRQRLAQAKSEIKKIIREYQISDNDIKDLLVKTNKVKPSNRPVPAGKTKRVKPVYQNPEGIDKWSGRGRSPLWVKSICNSKSISIDAFKADPRFRI